MENYKFVFDLDSTLTKQEILPEISKCINKYELMQNLTNETMLEIYLLRKVLRKESIY